MTIRELKLKAEAELADAGIEDAQFDATELTLKATGLSRTAFICNLNSPASDYASEGLKEMVEQRMSGCPLQYILGEWDFYGLKFKVGPGVLIPRPETEELVALALDWLQSRQDAGSRPRVLDLCAGSGCVGISIAENFSDCDVVAVEKSEDALQYAADNAAAHGLANYTLLKGDICDPEFAAGFEPADILVSNPPYISREEMNSLQTEVMHEPFMALYGGEDGLQFYRVISETWMPLVRPGGMLAVEIGETQGEAVFRLFSRFVKNTQIICDASGNNRIILCRFH